MIYLDTSAAVPLFVREPASAAVDAWFEACTEPLLSSDWIVTEFASALSIKERSGMLLSKDARAAWRSFEAFCESGLRLLTVQTPDRGSDPIRTFVPDVGFVTLSSAFNYAGGNPTPVFLQRIRDIGSPDAGSEPCSLGVP